jgi:hypothetical protein
VALRGDRAAAPAPGLSVDANDYKYWAFISYSHADEAWATWLHGALETYRVPRTLVGRRTSQGAIPPRLFPVFRDREELSSAADLSTKIQDALRQSRSVIVICSPTAAVSRWVNEEILAFKRMSREDRIFCLITDGEPGASARPESGQLECFPAALRDITHEPLAADARAGKDGREDAKLKLLAGLMDVGLDELRQREARRRRLHRIRMTAATAGLAVLAGLGYVLVADQGYPVPGGDAIRRQLDRQQVTVGRPVFSDAEVRRAAAAARRSLVQELDRRWRRRDWIIPTLATDRPGERALDVWLAGQAATAVFRVAATEGSRETFDEFRRIFEIAFAPGTPIEVNGVKYGWPAGHYLPGGRSVLTSSSTSGGTFWLIMALAEAVRHPGLLTGPQRDQVVGWLTEAQEATTLYRQEGGGGWNVFPNQLEPRQHSTYMAVLALMALLEVRAVGLGWEGSLEQRDTLTAATAQWLIDHFDGASVPPGWRGSPEDTGPVNDGLTIQTYGQLLRAEQEAGVRLPPDLLAAVAAYQSRLGERTMDYPTMSATYLRLYRLPGGAVIPGLDSLYFIWYPWAIDSTLRWLRRLEAHAAPRDEIVRARRVLGHLVVNLGPEAVRRAAGAYTFTVSETLYGLAGVPPP